MLKDVYRQSWHSLAIVELTGLGNGIVHTISCGVSSAMLFATIVREQLFFPAHRNSFGSVAIRRS